MFATWGEGIVFCNINPGLLGSLDPSRSIEMIPNLHFLKQSCIPDIIEAKKGFFLIANSKTCSYHQINLTSGGQHKLICPSFSAPISMQLLHGFDYDSFPYILCREREHLTIFNIRSKFRFKLKTVLSKNEFGSQMVTLGRLR